jgi:elongation factor P--beta-lysine ligase
MELGNADTELTDSKILKQNFETETKFRQENNLPLHPYDQKLLMLVAICHHVAGIGLGIDRLAMLFADTTDIDDILYFPTSKLIKE